MIQHRASCELVPIPFYRSWWSTAYDRNRCSHSSVPRYFVDRAGYRLNRTIPACTHSNQNPGYIGRWHIAEDRRCHSPHRKNLQKSDLLYVLNIALVKLVPGAHFTKYSSFDPGKLIYSHFQPLEVVSRYRDPQPQVVENNSYLFNFRPNIYKYWCLNIIPNNSELIG